MQDVKVAVPVTVPDGCVGKEERSVRVKVHDLSCELRKFSKMDVGNDRGLCSGFLVSDELLVCGSCGKGLVSRIGVEVVMPFPVLLLFVCKKAFGSWLSSRTALTL